MDSLSTRITQLRQGARANRAYIDLSIASSSIYASQPVITNSTSVSTKVTRLASLLSLLQREGFIAGWSVKTPRTQSDKKLLRVYLKYSPRGESAFRSIFQVSKPGRRVYLSTRALWQPYSSTGVFILSTPRGLLTDREARQNNVGGEVLFGIF